MNSDNLQSAHFRIRDMGKRRQIEGYYMLRASGLNKEKQQQVISLIYFCRYQSNMAKEVLDTIMSIQPKDSGGGSGETRESVVHHMAGEMLEKLPPDYVPHEVKAEQRRSR